MSDDLREFIQDLQDLRVLLVEEGRESELASLDAWIKSLHREVVSSLFEELFCSRCN